MELLVMYVTIIVIKFFLNLIDKAVHVYLVKIIYQNIILKVMDSMLVVIVIL